MSTTTTLESRPMQRTISRAVVLDEATVDRETARLVNVFTAALDRELGPGPWPRETMMGLWMALCNCAGITQAAMFRLDKRAGTHLGRTALEAMATEMVAMEKGTKGTHGRKA